MRHWLLLLVLAGCSHQTPTRKVETLVGHAPQNGRCSEVGDRIVARMAKDASDGDKEYYQQRYRDLYTRRCAADRWSDDAQNCFLAAATPDRNCDQLLTVKQRNMIECVDDAAATSGKPPQTAEARAAIESRCRDE